MNFFQAYETVLLEAVYDPSDKNIPLNQRSERQQAAIKAYSKKEKPPKVHISIKHADGTVSKHQFFHSKTDAPEVMADNHLKHMQGIHDKFNVGSRAESVHKVEVK
ncbi:hypothetical protein FDI24_gp089 [Acidovorax phage ACP17]|uniref:Uncharacterized protein n=1 Tax=Acidovorax phage ACP17 TaxID=2010329 RepID=A0A218M2T8_9CAUD|nr:hypothetical protein FDI24_gp089 [Acidovorax phage ACP17]ASD50368.1 hypothetical protein [Acidovorax phage ACP17]